MRGLIASVASTLAESWQEVRVHRGRVLLSLVGVAAAVCALSASIAFTDISAQAVKESSEQYGGRPATVTTGVYPTTGSSDREFVEKSYETFREVGDRFGVEYSSINAQTTLEVQYPDGTRHTQATLVDPDFNILHRMRFLQGGWLSERDTERRAPAMVVNRILWESIGSPDLVTNPTLPLPGLGGVTGVIVGVVDASDYDVATLYMLGEAYVAFAPDEDLQQMSLQFEMWVPEDTAEELAKQVGTAMSAGLGSGAQADSYRTDAGQYLDDSMVILRAITSGIAVVILVLGALGLLNIALVSVKQRIREIGIRRSFGASGGRVFVSVLLESVVATAVAGVIGVIAAVLVLRLIIALGLMGTDQLFEIPPFPLGAAVLGFASAVAVGALAGLIPALIAVRVKVIDAIRI